MERQNDSRGRLGSPLYLLSVQIYEGLYLNVSLKIPGTTSFILSMFTKGSDSHIKCLYISKKCKPSTPTPGLFKIKFFFVVLAVLEFTV